LVLVLPPHPDTTKAPATSRLSAAPDRVNIRTPLTSQGDEHTLRHRVEPSRGTMFRRWIGRWSATNALTQCEYTKP
jgi:hypothetical protein